MKVILVIGSQGSGKTQLIKEMMLKSHPLFKYRAISKMGELIEILTDDESDDSFFLESNNLTIDTIRTSSYSLPVQDEDTGLTRRIKKGLTLHPHLLEIITCRLNAVPYYYFDRVF